MDMSEDTKHTEAKAKRRKKLIKPSELIIGIVFIAVVAVLGMTLVNKITLKRDVVSARSVSDKVISNISKRDGAAIRAAGSPQFQSAYSAAALTQEFKSVEVATLKTPTLDRQIVIDTPAGRTVYFVYEYTALKVPFYVRTTIQHDSGHWYLTNISGNIDESALTGDY
jgi:hypothetical protein